MTILGYLLILIPNDFISNESASTPARPEGMFDTY